MARRRRKKSKRDSPRMPAGSGPGGDKPHDLLVRDLLGSPEHIAGELRSVLPAELAERIDWDTLRPEPEVLVDAIGESRVDLLFSAVARERTVYLYFLFEHQSTVDRAMIPRLLVSLGRIWLAIDKRRQPRSSGSTERYPVVIPTVLHHDARGWTAARSVAELLDWDHPTREAVGAYVPQFELLIDDLLGVPEVELLERDMTPLGRMVVWVLRAVRVAPAPELLPRWSAELDHARRTASRQAFEHLVRYLLKTDEGSSLFEALRSARLSEGVQEVVMGLRQEWERTASDEGREVGRKEGREEGRKEGREEGRAEVLLMQLRLKFELVELPDDVEDKVRRASAKEHDRWLERVLEAETLDDVWG